jgi:hypothetical protein
VAGAACPPPTRVKGYRASRFHWGTSAHKLFHTGPTLIASQFPLRAAGVDQLVRKARRRWKSGVGGGARTIIHREARGMHKQALGSGWR